MNQSILMRFLRLLWMLLPSCISSIQVFGQDKIIELKGIYGHPAPLWEAGFQLSDLGINAIFVHSGAIDLEMIQRARQEGAKVYAEFATLNGKGFVNDHPEAHAINEKGQPVEQASWFMGVCPTNTTFRAYRFQQLRDLLTQYELDGIWMDYVHWHAQFEDPEPILPETCFCEDCQRAFSSYSGVEIVGNDIPQQATWILQNKEEIWRDWRCEVIAQWAQEFRNILREIRPKALLGLYHCPWEDHEFNQARERILGLDYDRLTDIIDVYSPMVYHGRMHKSPGWVRENILWHEAKLDTQIQQGAKLWPIVQAHNDPTVITPEEFEIVLRGGLVGKSTGVMMFTTRAVAEDPGKIKVLRKIYTGKK